MPDWEAPQLQGWYFPGYARAIRHHHLCPCLLQAKKKVQTHANKCVKLRRAGSKVKWSKMLWGGAGAQSRSAPKRSQLFLWPERQEEPACWVVSGSSRLGVSIHVQRLSSTGNCSEVRLARRPVMLRLLGAEEDREQWGTRAWDPQACAVRQHYPNLTSLKELLYMVAHTCNLSMQEADAGRSLWVED